MKEKYIAYLYHIAQTVILPICLATATVAVAVALWSYNAQDLSLLHYATNGVCQHPLGYFGSSLAAILMYFFGSAAYLVPCLMLYSLVFATGYAQAEDQLDKIFGNMLGFVVICLLMAYHRVGLHDFGGHGGIVGTAGIAALSTFDPLAQAIILYTLLTVSSFLVLRFAHVYCVHYALRFIWSGVRYCLQVNNPPARMVRFFGKVLEWICSKIESMIKWSIALFRGSMILNSNSSIVQFEREDESIDVRIEQLLETLQDQPKESSKHSTSSEVEKSDQVSHQILTHAQDVPKAQVVKKYQLPDIEAMLGHGNYQQKNDVSMKELVELSAVLEEKLSLFGVKGKVVRIHPGPVITLFEYRPDVHVKLSKILGLEDDLAMALHALSIRIIAPIPGKDVVGFEVSNKVRKSVLLSDIFHSAAWIKFKGSLPLILGEDTAGNHIVVDLATMPHLLIAGSTGSGKSVALNCMLVSLLCAKKPEDMRLIIIDPKQIEFTAYEKLPHLLFPIVNDSKKALPIFKWLVMTMEQRYETMAELGVKNIFEHHKLEQERPEIEHMPFIVVIIDELADLMMTTGKDIETLIARIAQMSRAAGIYMIVATQRPSVDVITGLIKVNLPNRISFKVTSKVDSRTILDEIGAERLLGKGDMLFVDAKDPHMRRVHGAYVSEKEIAYLVDHATKQQATNFLDINDFFTTQSDDDNMLLDTDQDLYEQVVALLQECDEVSISMIQRRFRIGFNRSARIIETLQARGLIMATDGGKMRRVVKD